MHFNTFMSYMTSKPFSEIFKELKDKNDEKRALRKKEKEKKIEDAKDKCDVTIDDLSNDRTNMTKSAALKIFWVFIFFLVIKAFMILNEGSANKKREITEIKQSEAVSILNNPEANLRKILLERIL